jgi:hypothetical protein
VLNAFVALYVAFLITMGLFGAWVVIHVPDYDRCVNSGGQWHHVAAVCTAGNAR